MSKIISNNKVSKGKKIETLFETTVSEIVEFPCQICELFFKSNNDLILHIASFHEERDLLEFRCSICQASFLTNIDMEQHISSFHVDIRPYKCDQCLKSFAKKSILIQHKAIFTKNFSFEVN